MPLFGKQRKPLLNTAESQKAYDTQGRYTPLRANLGMASRNPVPGISAARQQIHSTTGFDPYTGIHGPMSTYPTRQARQGVVQQTRPQTPGSDYPEGGALRSVLGEKPAWYRPPTAPNVQQQVQGYRKQKIAELSGSGSVVPYGELMAPGMKPETELDQLARLVGVAKPTPVVGSGVSAAVDTSNADLFQRLAPEPPPWSNPASLEHSWSYRIGEKTPAEMDRLYGFIQKYNQGYDSGEFRSGNELTPGMKQVFDDTRARHDTLRQTREDRMGSFRDAQAVKRALRLGRLAGRRGSPVGAAISAALPERLRERVLGPQGGADRTEQIKAGTAMLGILSQQLAGMEPGPAKDALQKQFDNLSRSVMGMIGGGEDKDNNRVGAIQSGPTAPTGPARYAGMVQDISGVKPEKNTTHDAVLDGIMRNIKGNAAVLEYGTTPYSADEANRIKKWASSVGPFKDKLKERARKALAAGDFKTAYQLWYGV